MSASALTQNTIYTHPAAGSCVGIGAKQKRVPVHPLFETFDEQTEQTITDTRGRIPTWVEGSLIRVGPGKFEFGRHEVKHWYDGMGIIHRFNIKNGSVTFQSRYVESDAFKNNTAQQRITMAEFGTCATPDPCATRFQRFKSRFFNPKHSDNVNVNVLKRGDTLLVYSDAPVMQVVDMDMKSIGKLNIQDTLALSLTSSHPHFDADGTMYTYGSSFKGRPMHHIVKIPPPKSDCQRPDELLSNATILATIPARNPFAPSYAHSFGMTDKYLVYCETPVAMNVINMLSTVVMGRPMNEIFNYSPQHMAVFHIIRKQTGEVLPVKFQIPGLFFWHSINCYEEDNHIVLDVCHLSGFKNSDLFTEPLSDFRNGKWINEKKWAGYDHHPVRLVFPLRDLSKAVIRENLVSLADTTCTATLVNKNLVTVTTERLLPVGEDRIDMPVINYEMVNGKKYRYFYGTGLFINQHFMNALGKVDVQKRRTQKWQGTMNQYPSEPIFVPRPGATEEDDGVILSSVVDLDPSHPDFLLVIDGRTFKELGRACVSSNTRIPYSFHGSFYK